MFHIKDLGWSTACCGAGDKALGYTRFQSWLKLKAVQIHQILLLSKRGIWLCWKKTEALPVLHSPCPVAVPGEPSSAATAEAPRGLAAMAPPPYRLWVVLGKSPPLPWHCCSQASWFPWRAALPWTVHFFKWLSGAGSCLCTSGLQKESFCPAQLREGWLWDPELLWGHTLQLLWRERV